MDEKTKEAYEKKISKYEDSINYLTNKYEVELDELINSFNEQIKSLEDDCDLLISIVKEQKEQIKILEEINKINKEMISQKKTLLTDQASIIKDLNVKIIMLELENNIFKLNK
jgi:hypothetical protein